MKHYVYLHVHHDTGYPVIFYVGKGFGNRAYSKHSRNKLWQHVVAKHGYEVIIHRSNISEKESLEIERHLIAKIGRRDLGTGPLVNLSDGGKGSARKRNTQEKIIAQFRAAHGDRYDYSEVAYETVHVKVRIICPDHGPFEQNPKNHRNGAVCPGCISDRIRKTCIRKYGVDNPAKRDEARETNARKMRKQVADGTLRAGMVAKYGAAYVKQVPEIAKKISETMARRYGVANPYQINVEARVAKAAKTRIERGLWIDPSKLDAFDKYKHTVWSLTERNIREQGAHWLTQGRSRQMQLDHIYSLHDAFRHSVDPEVVASVCNLQLLPKRVNLSKGADSWMTIDDLLLAIAASDSGKVLDLRPNT